jgi:hypothetical protein
VRASERGGSQAERGEGGEWVSAGSIWIDLPICSEFRFSLGVIGFGPAPAPMEDRRVSHRCESSGLARVPKSSVSTVAIA